MGFLHTYLVSKNASGTFSSTPFFQECDIQYLELIILCMGKEGQALPDDSLAGEDWSGRPTRPHPSCVS